MRHKLTIGTLLLLALFLTLAPTILASTTWYVNGVSGSDRYTCMSSLSACKTIGHAIQLAQYPIESPDGQYVYFFRNNRVWRVNTDGSGEEALKGMPESGYVGERWFPYGSGIYFMSNSGGKDAIEFFDLTTQKVSRVYELEKPAPGYIGAMPVSSDGRWLLYPQIDEQSSNLMMIENWR